MTDLIDLLRPVVLAGIIGLFYFFEHRLMSAGSQLRFFAPNLNMCRFCGKTLLDNSPENTRAVSRWGSLHLSCAKRVQFSRYCWFASLIGCSIWFVQKLYLEFRLGR